MDLEKTGHNCLVHKFLEGKVSIKLHTWVSNSVRVKPIGDNTDREIGS